jgi:hypothetical protein
LLYINWNSNSFVVVVLVFLYNVIAVVFMSVTLYCFLHYCNLWKLFVAASQCSLLVKNYWLWPPNLLHLFIIIGCAQSFSLVYYLLGVPNLVQVCSIGFTSQFSLLMSYWLHPIFLTWVCFDVPNLVWLCYSIDCAPQCYLIVL